MAGPLYGLQRLKHARMSDLRGVPVVLSEAQKAELSRAVEEVWSGARSGVWLWADQTISSRVC
jgi:hypothetical protein